MCRHLFIATQLTPIKTHLAQSKLNLEIFTSALEKKVKNSSIILIYINNKAHISHHHDMAKDALHHKPQVKSCFVLKLGLTV